MYAIIFGCKKFHHYIYERRIRVETDHKPLIPISKKPLHAAPPRIQRMLVQLQKYDVDLVYVPGKLIPVADTLSRNCLSDTCPDVMSSVNVRVHAVLSNLQISDRRIQNIKFETGRDVQLQLLKWTILNGWPETRKQCNTLIIEYWNFREELSVADEVTLKGGKIIIPKVLRTEILGVLHTRHMGIEKCLKRARATLFWPKLSSDITKLILHCRVFLRYSYSNQKEPLINHPIPDRPWHVVATDLFEWDRKDFLLVVDYYSCFFEVEQLQSTTSISVIKKMKPMFARYARYKGPYHPKSNRLAEKYVRIVKRVFEKDRLDRQDPLIESKFIDHSVVRSKLESKRAHEKKCYDKAAKPLPPLEVGQGIQIQQKDKTWRPCTVLKRVRDRSFIVNSQGGLNRRNGQQLIHRSAKFQSFEPSSESPTGDIQITRNNTDTGLSVSLFCPEISKKPKK
ncbi:retrotransposon-like family member retr-1 [Paramuricea clavata]|uniref:Retrotransposon-like family member retr-1 n=1 Tax=Paramuricea clavata TaxID=317549 RepID=A0A7D9DDP0_PARCT|nr:retrotransposon-like family member retr-1 [Paramuricea clavata]